MKLAQVCSPEFAPSKRINVPLADHQTSMVMPQAPQVSNEAQVGVVSPHGACQVRASLARHNGGRATWRCSRSGPTKCGQASAPSFLSLRAQGSTRRGALSEGPGARVLACWAAVATLASPRQPALSCGQRGARGKLPAVGAAIWGAPETTSLSPSTTAGPNRFVKPDSRSSSRMARVCFM